jgi:outer membrane protein OmpA-like peptidoglycan-associated protein
MPDHPLDPNSPQEHLQPNSFYHHFLSVETAHPMQGLAEYLKKIILGFNTAEFEGLKQQILLLSEQYEQIDLSELKALSTEVESQLNSWDKLQDSAYLTELMVPCITDILNRRIQQSKTEVIEALLPIIDELVRLKAQQNRQQMSQAIASLIPLAIQHQIQTSPKEMAQAIAPEMGAAIQEQIRLDKDEIIKALAPTMGKTIQEQIILERDAMVDALYPVIGSTITRYLADALREINQKIETALSIHGIQRKIKAKMQGVSEAELIFLESMHANVQAVLLIHKASGLLMTEIQQEGESRLDFDMLAGMLTAIRSFVNDCVVNNKINRELNEIEYGDSRILIEVAGYCYLAVIMQGEPSQQFIQKIRKTLSDIIQQYSQTIQDFDGNQEIIPVGIKQQLKPLILQAELPPKRKIPILLILLVLFLLGLIFVPWQMAEARRRENQQVEMKAIEALTNEPELALYPLNVDAAKANQTLTLSGKVPSQQLHQRVETILQQTLPDWTLDNNIVTVKVPANPDQVEAEVKQMAAALNQMNGISISTEYNPPKVRLEGTVIQLEDIEKVIQAFEGIQGIEAVNSQLTIQPFPIATRIYFNLNSAKIIERDFEEKIRLISQYLKKYPQLRVKLIGYKDRRETGQYNNIGLKRSQAVQTALESYGIDRRRIEVNQAIGIPPGVAPDQRQWLNRTVMIEIINDNSND